MNKILLNFDIEEFDLPLEYKIHIDKEKQFEFSLNGLTKLRELLDKNNINSTFFATASFALKHPETIRKISKIHEIASHGLHHQIKKYDEKETDKSKKIIEEIISKKIKGFRFPRLQKPDYGSLKKLGFKYSSSISPTFIPRRYNNYFDKRGINLKKEMIEVPISTTRIIRMPLSWIFFRFFGLNFAKTATLSCIKNPGYVNLFFHPWEFNDLNNFKIPYYIRRNSGKKALKMLDDYIRWCKRKNYEFMSFEGFLGV